VGREGVVVSVAAPSAPPVACPYGMVLSSDLSRPSPSRRPSRAGRPLVGLPPCFPPASRPSPFCPPSGRPSLSPLPLCHSDRRAHSFSSEKARETGHGGHETPAGATARGGGGRAHRGRGPADHRVSGFMDTGAISASHDDPRGVLGTAAGVRVPFPRATRVALGSTVVPRE